MGPERFGGALVDVEHLAAVLGDVAGEHLACAMARPPCGSKWSRTRFMSRMWSSLMPLLPDSEKRMLGLLRL